MANFGNSKIFIGTIDYYKLILLERRVIRFRNFMYHQNSYKIFNPGEQSKKSD